MFYFTPGNLTLGRLVSEAGSLAVFCGSCIGVTRSCARWLAWVWFRREISHGPAYNAGVVYAANNNPVRLEARSENAINVNVK